MMSRCPGAFPTGMMSVAWCHIFVSDVVTGEDGIHHIVMPISVRPFRHGNSLDNARRDHTDLMNVYLVLLQFVETSRTSAGINLGSWIEADGRELPYRCE